MVKKTVAELQIEFLKKLKHTSEPPVKKSSKHSTKVLPKSLSRENVSGQKRPSRVPEKKVGGLELTEISASRSNSKRNFGRVALPAAKVDKQILQKARDKNRRAKVFKGTGQMFEWALELLTELPLNASRLSEEGKQDFYRAARQWLSQRGVKDE